MGSSRISSLFLLGLVLCAMLAVSNAKKDLVSGKFAKHRRMPKFPLLSKIRNAVLPSSRSPSPPTDNDSTKMHEPTTVTEDVYEEDEEEEEEEVMDDMEVDTEVKVSGVRVVPVRNPTPPPETMMEPSPVPVAADCFDVTPDNVYTCEEQKAFGKCDADFMVMGNYCAKTCGRPPCPAMEEESMECTDIPPGPHFSCAEQKEFGKCEEPFIANGNFCARTCGRAPCPPLDDEDDEDDEDCTTIAEGVEGSSLLSVLDLALEVTGLKDAFDDPDLSVTVFAPTNAAFQSLLSDLDLSADELLDYPDVLEEILGMHVLITPVMAEDLQNGGAYDSMNEGSLVEVVRSRGEVYIMSSYGMPAKVATADLDACGSIVHVVDTVLIPDRDVLVSLDIPQEIISSYEFKVQGVRG